jgi:ATPase subunit of ABC transporter with duplicated ATPase domains
MHRPLTIQNLGLSFPHKTCFENFTTQIHAGSRIAIIGQNGSGKTTLLKILQGLVEPSEGSIQKPDGLVVAAVPQIIEAFESLSGGQRLNAALSQALAL